MCPLGRDALVRLWAFFLSTQDRARGVVAELYPQQKKRKKVKDISYRVKNI